jgi:hypothetical protein
MWKLHQLVWQNYVPKSLEIGMWYMNRQTNQVYVLDKVPQNQEQYIQENGYPIELMLSDDNDNVVFHLILDDNDSIAWWDEGDHTDEFRSITIKDVNGIFEDVDGYISVLMDDETGEIVLEADKPILTFPRPEHMEKEDDDDDDEEICSSCNGSGEGNYDGSTCSACGGSGVEEMEYGCDGPDDDYDEGGDAIEWGGMNY